MVPLPELRSKVDPFTMGFKRGPFALAAFALLCLASVQPALGFTILVVVILLDSRYPHTCAMHSF